jgi:hypothetical protein
VSQKAGFDDGYVTGGERGPQLNKSEKGRLQITDQSVITLLTNKSVRGSDERASS